MSDSTRCGSRAHGGMYTGGTTRPLSRYGASTITSDVVSRPANSMPSSSPCPCWSTLRMKRWMIIAPSRYAPSFVKQMPPRTSPPRNTRAALR